MKNKGDAPKKDTAPQPKKGKGAEFKPFWIADEPKKGAGKPAQKTARPRPAAGKAASASSKAPETPAPALPATARPVRESAVKSAGSQDSARPAGPKGTGNKAALKTARPEPGQTRTEARPGSRSAAERTPVPATDAAPRATRKHGSEKGSETSKRHAKPGHHIAPAEHRPQHKSAQHGAEHGTKLHSGKILEVSIASTTNEGFGTTQYEGNRLLVAGGIPGEQLLVKVTYVGRRESFANTIRCIKPSADREPSPACHMGKCCDGCGLMQMRYPAQLTWKRSMVTREVRNYPSLGEVKVFDTIASPKQHNYRNSAKLVVAGKHTEPVIGIYRRNTHEVLEILDCPLHHPLINKVVKATKAGIKKGKVPIYNPKSEMGLLRYLVVRVAEPGDQVMVVFVTSEQGYNEMHHLAKFVQNAVPEVTVVAQNINNSTGNVIFGHKERFITKKQTLHAKLGDKTFSLSPHSFFQVNGGAARIIYEKVRELAALTGKERVIDVYCGIGGISLFLADRAEEVVGIEFVETAVADATQNAVLNGIKNCSFEAGDAAHLIEEIGEGGADLIVLNPPRKGCDEKVLKSVAGIKPARIIYVSCSPETLARDLDILSRLGYRTLEVHPVDMFPQTIHVEDVALLERI